MKDSMIAITIVISFVTAALTFYELIQFHVLPPPEVSTVVSRVPDTHAPRILTPDLSHPYYTPHDVD